MVSFTRFLSVEGIKGTWNALLRIGAGAGLGSLFGAYYLQGEFKRCQGQVQSRLEDLNKLIAD